MGVNGSVLWCGMVAGVVLWYVERHDQFLIYHYSLVLKWCCYDSYITSKQFLLSCTWSTVVYIHDATQSEADGFLYLIQWAVGFPDFAWSFDVFLWLRGPVLHSPRCCSWHTKTRYPIVTCTSRLHYAYTPSTHGGGSSTVSWLHCLIKILPRPVMDVFGVMKSFASVLPSPFHTHTGVHIPGRQHVMQLCLIMLMHCCSICLMSHNFVQCLYVMWYYIHQDLILHPLPR